MPLMKEFKRDDPPDFLNQWKILKSDDVPDFYIDPKDSFVLEIKFDSVIPSEAMSAGVTLRFPRVERVREDKDETDSLSDLLSLAGQGPLSSRNNQHQHQQPEEDVPHNLMDTTDARNSSKNGKSKPNKKRQKTEKEKDVFKKVPDHFRQNSGKLDEADFVSYAFEGVNVCVYGTEYMHTNESGCAIRYTKDEVIK